METITEVQFGSAPEQNRYMKSNFPISLYAKMMD
jgi:hypothetical protein